MPPPHITTLPPEVLQNVFGSLDPTDIVNDLPRVCSAFRYFIKGNRKLHQDVYLGWLDPPPSPDIDWETDLRDVVRLQAICLDPRPAEKKKPLLASVHSIAVRLLRNASPCLLGHTHQTHHCSLNASLLRKVFEPASAREAFLQRSTLFERVREDLWKCRRHGPGWTAIRQQSAHLHCLYGSPILDVDFGWGSGRTIGTYPLAASAVYDLRQHTDKTHWGPFLDDGSDGVDWEKVEAIVVVLVRNLSNQSATNSVFLRPWVVPFSGSWPRSYHQPPPLEPLGELEARDPYGITGTWYRILSFVDYTTLFHFNFPPNSDDLDPFEPLGPLNTDEVMRVIAMKLRVTKIDKPGPDDGQGLPMVHFRGTAQSLDNGTTVHEGNSDVRGHVRLTKQGEVRWTTYSIVRGRERWRSECVQVGGIQSARGVVGFWFDRDNDIQGPAGPTAFWKAQDERLRDAEFRDRAPGNYHVAYRPYLELDDLLMEEEQTHYFAHFDSETESDDSDEEIRDLLPGRGNIPVPTFGVFDLAHLPQTEQT